MRRALFTAVLVTICRSIIAQSSTPAIATYVPVPSAAIEPEIPPSVGYRVEAFGEGAYMITDGIYQAIFLVSTDCVIVVDAPPTIGHNMIDGIRSITNFPISHIVYSHSHADHIGGAYLLNSPDITIVAHEDTVKELAAAVDNGARPIPNVTFKHDYELCVGNQTLHLSYKGINHEPGNIFIYAPFQRLVMLVDVVYPGWVPFSRLGESQSIPGWIKAHDQILEYEFDYYVGGHLNRHGNRTDVMIQKEYITDLYNNCAEAIRLSALPPNATNPVSYNTSLANTEAANPDNSWADVNYYVDDLLTNYCNNKTNEKWQGRLAALDVYGYSNANTMVESLRLDFGILGAAGVTN